jgi:hypothetical protein
MGMLVKIIVIVNVIVLGKREPYNKCFISSWYFERTLYFMNFAIKQTKKNEHGKLLARIESCANTSEQGARN